MSLCPWVRPWTFSFSINRKKCCFIEHVVPVARRKRSMMPAREKGEFYKKDRKVLRFFCKYKDSRLQGDKRDYILYYYLLNDTIEIKEVGELVALWLLLSGCCFVVVVVVVVVSCVECVAPKSTCYIATCRQQSLCIRTQRFCDRSLLLVGTDITVNVSQASSRG